MNYFRTVWTLCSGTRSFPALARGSSWRAVLYVFLTMALLSLLLAFLSTFASCASVSERARRFFAETGGVEIRDGEFSFKNSPEKAQIYTMSEDFRIACYPGRTFELRDMQAIPGEYGLFFLPKMLFFWMRADADSFQILSVRPDEAATLFSPERQETASAPSLFNAIAARQNKPVTGVELCRLMAENMASASPQEPASPPSVSNGTAPSVSNEKTETEPVSGVSGKGKNDFLFDSPAAAIQIVLAVNWTRVFAAYFIKPLLLVVMTLFFFSLVQYLRAGVLPKRISYGAALNVSAYSVIPPYLLASLLSALSLPWPSFDMAFLIAYFLYQMFAYVAVLRELNPPGTGRNDADGF